MALLTPLKRHTYRAGRRAVREWHAVWRDRRLDRLERMDLPRAGELARALRRVAADGAEGGDPSLWRERIEEERAAMLESELPIATAAEREAGTEKPGLTLAGACGSSIAPPAGMLLHHLIRETRPSVALELGTNVGISAAYQASALASFGGRLNTFEGMQGRLQQAQALHARLGLDNLDYHLGPFQRTLEPALDGLAPVEYALIDGHHQYEPTLRYFDLICGHSAEGAVLVFDDIRWSRDMRRAWDAVRRDPRVRTVIDLYWMGICVVGARNAEPAPSIFVELWVERGK